MADLDQVFSTSYEQARDRFLAAAAGLDVQSHRCPGAGREGEPLFMDVARLGPADAPAVLLVSSACHGVEGPCGSAVQVALLRDAEFRARASRLGVAVVMVHALNPWGFSHGRRVTQEGVDLNRNFVDFAHALPHNPGYDELASAIVPATWPPTEADDARIAAYGAAHGDAALRAALTGGQYQHPAGLYYGGTAATWSHRTIRLVLWQQAARAERLGWIDVHTGLGPPGHGERIWAGRDDEAGQHRAVAWWGTAVTFLQDGTASSPPLQGCLWHAAYDECPQAEFTGIALEFGTVSHERTIRALRADHWAAAHATQAGSRRDEIRAGMHDAFFVDTPEWKAAVLAQAREAAMQAIDGLGRRAGTAPGVPQGSYWG